MLSIRLSKIGKKNRPAYKIVVGAKRRGRDSRSLEILGFFDPAQKKVWKLNKPRFEYWQKVGAQVSAAVERIFK